MSDRMDEVVPDKVDEAWAKYWLPADASAATRADLVLVVNRRIAAAKQAGLSEGYNLHVHDGRQALEKHRVDECGGSEVCILCVVYDKGKKDSATLLLPYVSHTSKCSVKAGIRSCNCGMQVTLANIQEVKP